MIRPITEYAAPLWHSGLIESDCKKIEKLPKKALGIILGVTYIDYKRYYKFNNQVLSYGNVIRKLGLIPLSERREILTNNFALKTFKQGIHKKMFQEKENVISTRNPNVVVERQYNSDRHYKSAIPYMQRILNSVKWTIILLIQFFYIKC